MGLFVLQCKHRQGDSNPGNVIESPCSTRHFCHDLELHRGDLISSPVDSIVSLFHQKKLRTQLCGEKLLHFWMIVKKGVAEKYLFPTELGM